MSEWRLCDLAGGIGTGAAGVETATGGVGVGEKEVEVSSIGFEAFVGGGDLGGFTSGADQTVVDADMGEDMRIGPEGPRTVSAGSNNFSPAGDLDGVFGGLFTSLVRPRALALRTRAWFDCDRCAEASLSLRALAPLMWLFWFILANGQLVF